MENGLVAAVAERAEQRPLLARRLGEQRQRLVGVGGDHHVVEHVAARRAASTTTTRPPIALDARRARADPDAPGERRARRVDIGAAAADDGAPDRPPGQAQQPVIVVEAQEGGRGIVENLVGRRRPDRARHRHDVMVAERGAVAAGARDSRRA